MSAPDFGYGDDEKMLREEVRKLADAHASLPKLRALVAGDHDIYEKGGAPAYSREAWDAMVALGLPGMAVPEAHGGLAAKHVGMAGVLEELGLHAMPSPLAATFAAAHVLTAADAGEALGRIANGEPAALAHLDSRGRDAGSAVSLRGGALHGELGFVEDGDKAAFFVVVAREGDEPVLAVVDAGAQGLTVARDRIIDLTRGQVRLRFDGCALPASAIVARGAAARAALDGSLAARLIIPTADLVGVSEWQLRTTTEYAKVREQFGRAIGTFQAVKHPLVDMMIGIDQARSLLYAAACAVDEGDERALVLARMAKSKASDVGRYASGRSVQLHGGIGFTWECDVHLFFKRSGHAQQLLGDGARQRTELAKVIVG